MVPDEHPLSGSCRTEPAPENPSSHPAICCRRSLTQRKVLSPSDLPSEGGQSPLVFATEEHSADLKQDLRALGVAYERVKSYKTLNARGKWVRYTRTRSRWDDWILALTSRSLEPLSLTIVLYALGPRTKASVQVP